MDMTKTDHNDLLVVPQLNDIAAMLDKVVDDAWLRALSYLGIFLEETSRSDSCSQLTLSAPSASWMTARRPNARMGRSIAQVSN